MKAKVVLFFAQIICEPLRIQLMREHVINNFTNNEGVGVKTPLDLVISRDVCSTAGA